MREMKRTGGCCIALAAMFLAGCHHAPNATSAFYGDWTLTAPVLGQGTVSFSESEFTEKWQASVNGGTSTLLISGPYEVSGSALHLDPKTFQLQGQSADMLTLIQGDLEKARAWDFSVSWSTNDLAYLTATNAYQCTIAMSISRNGSSPNMGKLAFSFSDDKANDHLVFEGGSQMTAPMVQNDPAPAQMATPVQPSYQPQADPYSNASSGTIVTGDAPSDGSQDQNATQQAEAQPAPTDSTPSNTPPDTNNQDEQRF